MPAADPAAELRAAARLWLGLGCLGLREVGRGDASHLGMLAVCLGRFLGAALLAGFPAGARPDRAGRSRG